MFLILANGLPIPSRIWDRCYGYACEDAKEDYIFCRIHHTDESVYNMAFAGCEYYIEQITTWKYLSELFFDLKTAITNLTVRIAAAIVPYSFV